MKGSGSIMLCGGANACWGKLVAGQGFTRSIPRHSPIFGNGGLMGEKDVTEKKLLEDNRRFADLVNAAVCMGRQVIRAEDLQEADPVSAAAIRSRSRSRSSSDAVFKERRRDILRKATRSMNFILIGIENQENVHYAMPARTMLMDALTYEKQLAGRRKMHREKKDLQPGGEFLSGFARGEKLKPICTIVVYYGKELWDGAVSLREMLDLTDIPPELCGMINDYPIHLVDVRRFEGINLLQTDLKQIFGYLQCYDNRKKLFSFVQENHDVFASLPADAYHFLQSVDSPGFLKKYADILHSSENKEGYNMDDTLQRMFEEYNAEGRNDGIRLTKEAIRLHALGKSIAEIAAILHVTEEQARMMTA